MWGISHIRLNGGENREKQPKNCQNHDFQRVVVRKSRSWHAKISITFAYAKWPNRLDVKNATRIQPSTKPASNSSNLVQHKMPLIWHSTIDSTSLFTSQHFLRHGFLCFAWPS